jgi:hypothetical protein
MAKFISSNSEAKNEFLKLMNGYREYYWTVAWADFNFDISKELVKNESRIRKLVIGLSFYGTNPDFIKRFHKHRNVKFVTNETTGTFHPKLFLFKNTPSDWQVIIGSGNFTKAAFGVNTEVFLLINSEKNPSMLSDIEKFIESQWNLSKTVNKLFVDDYIKKKKKFRQTKPKLPQRGIITPVYDKTWREYFRLLQKGGFENGLALQHWVRRQFSRQPLFHKMKLDIRKAIAGFGYVEDDIEFGCFGTTYARGYFKQAVIERPEVISAALNAIPRTGKVTEKDYDNFIEIFGKEFESQELACATRLLCLWRPDYFVNFNGKNKARLADALNTKPSRVNYDSYWSLIVEPIKNTNWKPVGAKQKEVFKHRAALLDRIYYEED